MGNGIIVSAKMMSSGQDDRVGEVPVQSAAKGFIFLFAPQTENFLSTEFLDFRQNRHAFSSGFGWQPRQLRNRRLREKFRRRPWMFGSIMP